ncbi:hypothetical protein Bmyc01_58280 [Bacillus mycoides]|nr:hypothetical protein Bmyc01_58280 [Bacillus mycoides]
MGGKIAPWFGESGMGTQSEFIELPPLSLRLEEGGFLSKEFYRTLIY